MKLVPAFAAAAALTFAAASARADVLFSNFGPGDSYVTATGWAVSTATTFLGEVSPAETFTAAADGDVSEIDIAMARVQGAGGVDVNLWTDGFAALLGSWHLASLNIFGVPAPPVAITGITGVHLTGGTSYILEAKALGTQWAAWDWSSTLSSAQHYRNQQPTTGTERQGAFRVLSAAAAPEPAAWALMLVGFGGLGAMLRRRRAEAVAA